MSTLMQDQDWYADALCAEIGGDEWFPEKGGSSREAKAVCNGTATRPPCPVRDQCLKFALDNDERFGIYGGTSERERRRMQKTGTSPSDTVPPAQEPTMTTAEQPAPRSYGQTYIGDAGHRPIPTDVDTTRPKTPRASLPTGLDWSKHTAPATEAKAPAASKSDFRCRWCRQPADDLVDEMCGACRHDATTQFTPPTVGGVNATPVAVQDSGDPGTKDTEEATFLSVAGDPCAPDQEEETEDERVEELPTYILDIAVLMRDTEGHPDPAVRTARKVVANALVGLNKALTAVPAPVATSAFEVFQRPPTPRGTRPNAPRGRRVNVDQIVRLYEAGCSIPALARDLGHSKNTIRSVLLERDVELRDDRKTHSGGNNRIEAYPDQLVADVRRLYLEDGLSQAKVAEQLDVSTKVVANVMAKHDITPRPPASEGNNGTRTYVNNSQRIAARVAALGVDAARIRDWAREHGHQVPSRGSVPIHLVDAYEAAHNNSQENA